MMYPSITAAAQGYLRCGICETLQASSVGARCQVCHEPLYAREPHSVQKSLAYLTTAVLLYIPANMLPIMWTEQFGQVTASTIVGGVISLWQHGAYLVASVIFAASVVVPILKMLSLGWLCWLVRRGGVAHQHQASSVYGLTELIGKWSMVDVFVVALLAALIQVGSILTIKPGTAALAFAGMVIATMLAARSFDMRLVWDLEEGDQDE